MLQLYKNIKNRRLELKMSQQELADKTGYTDRSSIAKIEKGEVDISQSKIEAFAKALGTTAGELMGWDDNYREEQNDIFQDIINNLTDENRQKLEEFAQFLLSKQVPAEA